MTFGYNNLVVGDKLALEPDAPQLAPGFKRGPRQVGHDSDLEVRYLTLCKLRPLAPLRQALDHVEPGKLAFDFEAGSLRGQLWSRLGELIGGRPYFVLDSTHPDDEVALARALMLLETPPVMVVVPKDFARSSEVPALLRDLGLSVSRLCAEMTQPRRSSAPAPNAVVVDAGTLAECPFLEQFAAAGLLEHADGFADYRRGVRMETEDPVEFFKWIVKNIRYLVVGCKHG